MRAVCSALIACSVALRKESVDRNQQRGDGCKSVAVSLSARRAWIEMVVIVMVSVAGVVALRKESVDRNEITITDIDFRIMSLSARRAWIEISIL